MAVSKPVAYKFPKSLGACADRLHELKEKRATQQKIADAIEAEEKALKAHIINSVPKGDTGASGKLYRATVVSKIIPQVKDWDKFYEFIRKNKRFDMLQRRPSESAIAEMWDNKKSVPGVETFTVVSVSLAKL